MTFTARDAKILALHNNTQRYCRLLATDLTDFERGVVHRRLAEDQLAIEALERELAEEEQWKRARQSAVLLARMRSLLLMLWTAPPPARERHGSRSN